MDPRPTRRRGPVPAVRGPATVPPPRAWIRAGPFPQKGPFRVKSILCLALVATTLPAGVAALQSAEPAVASPAPVAVAGLPPGPAEIALRDRVQRLRAAARAHA